MDISKNSTAMLAHPSYRSHEASKATRTASAQKPLSCTSCRQRKIKCERLYPCDQCLKSGIECVFPTRGVRAPRARREDVRDAELLNRIKRLEQMLAKKAGIGPIILAGDGASSILLPPIPSSGEITEARPSVTLDDPYTAFAKQQASSSRHLDGDFWSSLSNEFDGLRQLIEGDVDNEDEFDDSASHSVERTYFSPYSSPGFIFQDSKSVVGPDLIPPSPAQSQVLVQFYFANVDPVCKILHRPTATAYFSNFEALIDPTTHQFKFKSFAAVTFAAYFAAIASMPPEECLTQLGESKDVLVARYRRNTEAALMGADFLNSLEVITLQALIIYIVVQRSLNRSQSTWTLIGLAMRIAQGLGLHRDGDGHAFSVFEGEMRRRLWWQILALDMKSSEDRRSEPIFAENCFSTLLPRNLNDEEFKFDSQYSLHEKTGPTEITLCLLAMDALYTSRKINFNSQASEPGFSKLQEMELTVREYAHRVESTYLAGFDVSDPRTKLLCLMGHYWVSKLWLTLYYPLQHRKSLPKAQSGTQGLQKALIFLNLHEAIEQHPSSAGFTWLFKTYVPWHALAVMLAELCAQPTGSLADRAWEIIESRFNEWNGRVADVKEGMVWGAIKKLLKRAKSARQNDSSSFTNQNLNSLNLDPTVQGFNASGPSNLGLEGSSFDLQSLNDFGFLDQTANEQLNFLAFTPMDTFTADIGLSGMTNNLDNWNDFMVDMNALHGEVLPDFYSI